MINTNYDIANPTHERLAARSVKGSWAKHEVWSLTKNRFSLFFDFLYHETHQYRSHHLLCSPRYTRSWTSPRYCCTPRSRHNCCLQGRRTRRCLQFFKVRIPRNQWREKELAHPFRLIAQCAYRKKSFLYQERSQKQPSPVQVTPSPT